MNNTFFAIISLLYGINTCLNAQNQHNEKDSIYIDIVENHKEPHKVLHAEPLYIDLIRDLGARKGEKEWNVGFGLSDNLMFDSHEALIEYEWAPINRLGLEIELPFTFYSPNSGFNQSFRPSNKLNSLKVAGQYSFLVNEFSATSMAVGYINEFIFSDFENFGKPLFKGNTFNPFLVIAKRWTNNFHSLIYTGPKLKYVYNSMIFDNTFEVNSSIHYMIPGTRNFIGVEVNKSAEKGVLNGVIRPQMRLSIANNLMIGIVAGIPFEKRNERLSSFIRLIWEPGHPKH
jgi:hypothetical protein